MTQPSPLRAFCDYQLSFFPITLNCPLLSFDRRKAVLFAICVLACYWAVLIYYLGVQWSVYEPYNYGWAVPFLCLYLLWRGVGRRGQKADKGPLGAEAAGGREEGTTRQLTTDHGPREHTRSGGFIDSGSGGSVVLWSVGLCALLYAPTRFFHEANPIWRLTSWALAVEVIGLTLLTLHLLRGQATAIRGEEPDRGSLHDDFSLHGDHEPGRANGPLSLALSPSEGEREVPVARGRRFRESQEAAVAGQWVMPTVWAFAFPICFLLVAVPWPSGLESFLTQRLMRLNVATTVELLGLFGVPAIQHGNVIEVGAGVVGIDEACSGIRSLQATLMLALFFGEVYRLTVRRRLGLILLGFLLAFVFNAGRTLLLTSIASARGIGAMDAWHDPAGVTILMACFFSLWLLARALRRRESSGGKAERPKSFGQGAEGVRQAPEAGVPSTLDAQLSSLNPQPAAPGRGQRSNVTAEKTVETVGILRGARTTQLKLGVNESGLGPPMHLNSFVRVVACITRLRPRFPLTGSPVVSLCLLVWLLVVEGGTELWYRYHEHSPTAVKQWFLNAEGLGRSFTKLQIPSAIAGQFCADEGTAGRWVDEAGNAWQLYYFRWRPAHSLRRRVAIQLAKTHGPEKCLPAVGMQLSAYLGTITVPVAGMELAVQQYEFNAEGRPLHVFYGIYEDTSGSAELANRRRNSASRVAAALAGSRNSGQRFLEVAVGGYEKPQDARAAFVAELGKMIKVGE